MGALGGILQRQIHFRATFGTEQGGEWNWTPERRGSADAMIRSECPRGTTRPREKKKSRSKRHRAAKKELSTGFSISFSFFCYVCYRGPAASCITLDIQIRLKCFPFGIRRRLKRRVVSGWDVIGILSGRRFSSATH
jgi:hypothetical protein